MSDAVSNIPAPDDAGAGSPCRPAHGVPVIGLAGGIGSGKSTVAQVLRELGCLVSNSDEQARAALRDPAILRTLVGWWGDSILDPATKEINRSAVARIVFSDPEQRRRLESLTHPWIEAKRRAEFAAAPPHVRAMVIDAPLLFEAGLDHACDAVIFVDAPQAVRLDRVRRTRGWEPAELARREAAQWPLDLKRSRADHLVSNNGDLAELRLEVARTLDEIVENQRS